MNITFINGSPKAKAEGSASHVILNDLRTFLPNQKINEIHLNKQEVSEEQMQLLKSSDAIVFSFPLYVDSVPSQLLSCLYEMEKSLYALPVRVFAISNNGFFEGVQNRYALEVIRNWAVRTKLFWGMGIGIGGGGMILGQNIPVGKGSKKDMGRAMEKLSDSILNNKSGEDILVNMNFPRFLYKMIADHGWKVKARRNGLKIKDLYKTL
ncbi:MAG: NAD(P)H-dependent oxidoreductase [Bacteroidales bacterium]|jgi:hypothetical protein|nr:NAD(P)H-dependent oxidoreductase [Bacteroidales bacterium]